MGEDLWCCGDLCMVGGCLIQQCGFYMGVYGYVFRVVGFVKVGYFLGVGFQIEYYRLEFFVMDVFLMFVEDYFCVGLFLWLVQCSGYIRLMIVMFVDYIILVEFVGVMQDWCKVMFFDDVGFFWVVNGVYKGGCQIDYFD